jgi:hypothetical protein
MFDLGTIREVVRASVRPGRLWLIQAVANPILFFLFVFWLLLPVEHGWQVVLNAVLVLFVAMSVVTLQAGTLNYFHDRDRNGAANSSLARSFIRGLRNALAAAILFAIIYAFWLLVGKANAHGYEVSAYLRSELPVWLRRHLTLNLMLDAFKTLIFAAWWIIVPGLFLPFVSAVSDEGFRGFGRSGWANWRRLVTRGSYWLILLGAAIIGVYATTKLMGWTPNFDKSTMRQEGISLGWRLLVSYAFGLSAWMLTCSTVAVLGGRSRASVNIAGESAL